MLRTGNIGCAAGVGGNTVGLTGLVLEPESACPLALPVLSVACCGDSSSGNMFVEGDPRLSDFCTTLFNTPPGLVVPLGGCDDGREALGLDCLKLAAYSPPALNLPEEAFAPFSADAAEFWAELLISTSSPSLSASGKYKNAMASF